MAKDFWGREIVVAEPKKKPRWKPEQPIRRPAYCAENNDIAGWLTANMPQTFAEINDLRKALRLKKRVGNYDASVHMAGTGRKLTLVKGPNGNVLIVSRKARAYFNKRLKFRETILEVTAKQFGLVADQRPK